jgi:hypothetical protein
MGSPSSPDLPPLPPPPKIEDDAGDDELARSRRRREADRVGAKQFRVDPPSSATSTGIRLPD